MFCKSFYLMFLLSFSFALKGGGCGMIEYFLSFSARYNINTPTKQQKNQSCQETYTYTLPPISDQHSSAQTQAHMVHVIPQSALHLPCESTLIERSGYFFYRT